MPRDATVKDVLYALEYGGAELVRKPGSRSPWAVEPGGIRVPQSVADAVRGTPGVVLAHSSRAGEARYAWRSAA